MNLLIRIGPMVVGVALLFASGITADDGLPRVLVLGDVVYNQPSRSAGTELKQQAKVVWVNPGSSTSALENLDELLGDEKWDVIYFNFGLADLHYRDPNTKSARAMSKHAGGVRGCDPKGYEANLREITEQLKMTGAKLIWASTTPITSSAMDNIFDPGSEVEYNAIAAKIMAEQNVSIIDMHAYVLKNIEKKKDSSPFGFKGLLLHPPMVDHILKTLKPD